MGKCFVIQGELHIANHHGCCWRNMEFEELSGQSVDRGWGVRDTGLVWVKGKKVLGYPNFVTIEDIFYYLENYENEMKGNAKE